MIFIYKHLSGVRVRTYRGYSSESFDLIYQPRRPNWSTVGEGGGEGGSLSAGGELLRVNIVPGSTAPAPPHPWPGTWYRI